MPGAASPRATRALFAVVALLALLSALLCAAIASPAPAAADTTRGIPAGAPPAAFSTEPTIPKPDNWPFPDSFPRTSGTERLGGGAAYWSDFLYDDHGAAGVQVSQPAAGLAPTDGTYTYADPRAKNNGADIFRSAVGLTSKASVWRVDWNTFDSPDVPIAEWVFDTDNNAATGATAWPAGAGVRSAGIDRALVVSSRGARLLDATSGATLKSYAVTVDLKAGSFVVSVPRADLPTRNSWKVRLAAGVADPSGFAFAPVDEAHGATPGQPAVYNVSFRSISQEPPVTGTESGTPQLPAGADGLARFRTGNFWMEDRQAAALATGDVSQFSQTVHWGELSNKRSTPEPRPTGWSNRWYVSRINLGGGVVSDSSPQGDLRPNFLGRVQPYGVYVPTSYNPSKATPLTWELHSLGVNHNQYSSLDPRFLRQLCEQRHSICATTLGFGPDGWYFDEAEADFWWVWHALAQAYNLDPERTVISGYSMGGFASYKLGLSYPDLFAKAEPIAGPPGCGLRFAQGAGGPAGPGRCTSDGDTTPLVPNALQVPYVVGHGVLDELVPYSSVAQQIAAFDSAGLRYHFETYPLEDHLIWAVQDGFDSLVAQLGNPQRVKNPGTISYTWRPYLSRSDLGIGTTGAYWLRSPTARNGAPGQLATLNATSKMRPERPHTAVKHYSANIPGSPTPSTVVDNVWNLGPLPPASPVLTLKATNVASVTVDLVRAGFPAGTKGTLTVTTDGPLQLRLTGLKPGEAVKVTPGTTAHANSGGVAVVQLPASGTYTIKLG